MSARARAWAERAVIALILACALVVLAARVHRVDLPLERDEGEYAYIAQQLLRGAPLYTEAYTMKLPGVPLAYAATFALFGESARAVHLLGILADLAGALCAVLLVRRALRTAAPTTALFAGVLCFALTSLLALDGFTTNCEKLAGPLVMASLAVVLGSVSAWEKRAALLAGALMGLAFVCKQQVVPMGVVAGALLVLRPREGGLVLRARLRDGALFSLAVFVPYLACMALVRVHGGAPAFDTFWFQTVDYARAYLGYVVDPLIFFMLVWDDLVREPLFWFCALGVLALPIPHAFPRWIRAAIGAWFVASCVALSIGLVFTRHYFLFAAAPLAVAGALLASRHLFLRALMVVALVASLAWNRAAMFTKTDERVSIDHYKQTTFVESKALAHELAKRTKPDERVLILGSNPELLFNAQRRSVTPYIYFYPLLERQPFAEQQQREVIASVDSAQPRFIVVHRKTLRQLAWEPALRTWVDEMLPHYKVVWPKGGPPETVSLGGAGTLRRSLYLLERE